MKIDVSILLWLEIERSIWWHLCKRCHTDSENWAKGHLQALTLPQTTSAPAQTWSLPQCSFKNPKLSGWGQQVNRNHFPTWLVHHLPHYHTHLPTRATPSALPPCCRGGFDLLMVQSVVWFGLVTCTLPTAPKVSLSPPKRALEFSQQPPICWSFYLSAFSCVDFSYSSSSVFCWFVSFHKMRLCYVCQASPQPTIL